jgi:DNA modification methylase
MTARFEVMMSWRVLNGDALTQLETLDSESVHCCVTSPPYWGLRDYGHDGQLGLEKTPEEYVANMVRVFAEVKRVLRDDGTCWVNLGDSYAGAGAGGGGNRKGNEHGQHDELVGKGVRGHVPPGRA